MAATEVLRRTQNPQRTRALNGDFAREAIGDERGQERPEDRPKGHGAGDEALGGGYRIVENPLVSARAQHAADGANVKSEEAPAYGREGADGVEIPDLVHDGGLMLKTPWEEIRRPEAFNSNTTKRSFNHANVTKRDGSLVSPTRDTSLSLRQCDLALLGKWRHKRSLREGPATAAILGPTTRTTGSRIFDARSTGSAACMGCAKATLQTSTNVTQKG